LFWASRSVKSPERRPACFLVETGHARLLLDLGLLGEDAEGRAPHHGLGAGEGFQLFENPRALGGFPQGGKEEKKIRLGHAGAVERPGRRLKRCAFERCVLRVTRSRVNHFYDDQGDYIRDSRF